MELGQKKRPKGRIPELVNIDGKKASRIVSSALDRSTTRPLWLDADSVKELLNVYGIRLTLSRPARSLEDAKKAAREIGFPVVVKLVSDSIVHKTEVGGVVLDLRSEEVEQAFVQIRERLVSLERGHEMQGVVVQQMISGGTETIIGVTQDPSFGPS